LRILVNQNALKLRQDNTKIIKKMAAD